MSSSRDRLSATAAQKAAAEQRRAVRGAQYRVALGLPVEDVLPTELGTVGGSRGGHGGRRINQGTTGQPAPWHAEVRRRAARTRTALDE